MKELKIELEEKNIKKLNQIAESSNRSVDAVVDDLVKTFCFIPTIVAGDLEEYFLLQQDKLETVDKHRKSSLTEERQNSYNRMRYFIDMVYEAQAKQIKKIEEE